MTSEQSGGSASGASKGRSTSDELQYLCIVPAEQESVVGREFLVEIWTAIFASKWLIVLITSFFFAFSVVYSISAQEWFRSSMLLAPANLDANDSLLSSRFSAFGGLAGLSGLSSSGTDNIESVAILTSRDFVRGFIIENSLLPILYPKLWDESEGQWYSKNEKDIPDVRTAVRFFRKEVQGVSRDAETGLITLSISWTNAKTAATWAQELVERLNRHMRERALLEASSRVQYLKTRLQDTSNNALRESIVNLLEIEMQKLMMAQGSEEFAFHVIDSAQVPESRFRPQRTLIVVLSTFLGMVLAVLLAIARSSFRRPVSTS